MKHRLLPLLTAAAVIFGYRLHTSLQDAAPSPAAQRAVSGTERGRKSDAPSAPAGVPAARWQEIKADLAAEARKFAAAGTTAGTWYAVNPENRFELAVAEHGEVKVTPLAVRTAEREFTMPAAEQVISPGGEAPDWSWSVQAHAIGRSGAMTDISSRGEVRSMEHRVEQEIAAGPCSATAWTLNAADGVEQGWDIHHAPPGEGELRLDLALSTGLRPHLAGGGQEIRFHAEDGSEAAAWDKLIVRDARGKLLPARMELSGDRITLAVNDRGASYPVRIDPRLHSLDQGLAAGDPEDFSHFGMRVAVCGPWVVVSQPRATVAGVAGAGAVYLFDMLGGAPGTAVRKFTPPTPGAANEFGWTLAIQGSVLAIGEPGSSFTASAAGAVWFYNLDNPAAGPVDVIPGPSAGSRIGLHLAWHGNTLAAGGRGGVYLYTRRPVGSWVEGARLTDLPEWGRVEAGFGSSLALSGDTLAVGSPIAETFAGEVRFYQLVRGGDLITPRLLDTYAGPHPNALMGHACAASGGIFAVGAPRHRPIGLPAEQGGGTVTLFQRTAAGIVQLRTLFNPEPALVDEYGAGVALLGGVLAAGAPVNADTSGTSTMQRIYLHCQSEGGVENWGVAQTLALSSAVTGTRGFGHSIAIDPERLVVGSSNFLEVTRGVSAPGRGSAHVYSAADCGWKWTNFITSPSGSAGNRLGETLAADGTTAVSGAPGRSMIHFHQRTTLLNDDWGIVLNRSVSLGDISSFIGAAYTVSELGRAVALDGDLAVAGARFNHGALPGNSTGGVVIFSRNAGGSGAWGVVDVVLAPSGPDTSFGRSVALQADTLVVGAPDHDRDGLSAPGTAYVFRRNASTADWELTATLLPQATKQINPFTTAVVPDSLGFARFGSAVAVFGERIVVTARDYQTSDKPGFVPEGMAYSYLRNAGGADAWGYERRVFHPGMEALGAFGAAVAMDGEWIVIGAPGENLWTAGDGTTRFGNVWVWRVRGGLWSSPERIDGSVHEGIGLGQSVDVSDNRIAAGQSARTPVTDSHVAVYEHGYSTAGQPAWTARRLLSPTGVISATPLETGRSVALTFGSCLAGCPGLENGRGAVSAFIDEPCGPWSLMPGRPSGPGSDLIIESESETLVLNSGGSSRVHVYDRNAGGPDQWGEVQEIDVPVTVSKPTLSMTLGRGILAVGDRDAEKPGIGTTGGVHIYRRGSFGPFVPVTVIYPQDDVLNQHFGEALDHDGDRLAIGAPYWSNVPSGILQNGRVFYHDRNQGGADAWGYISFSSPASTFGGELYGAEVAMEDDVVAIAAPGYPTSFSGAKGRVFIRRRTPGNSPLWQSVKLLDAPAAQQTPDGLFARKLSLSAGRLAVMGNDYVNIYRRHTLSAGEDWVLSREITGIAPVTISLCGNRLALSRSLSPSGSVLEMREESTTPSSWSPVQSIHAPPAGLLVNFSSVKLTDTFLAAAVGGTARIYRPYPSAYLEWAASYGLTDTVGAPEADPDGDGASNLQECALGSDPLAASSRRDPLVRLVGNRLSLSMILADRCRSFIGFQVEASSDLQTWSVVDPGASPYVLDTGHIYEIDDTQLIGAAPRRYLRVRFRVLSLP